MNKILFYNRKGGVGKTTSVVNIGATLAKHFDKRVLIVDCDSQCNTTEYLTTHEDIILDKSLEDVFCGDTENVIHKIKILEHGNLIDTNMDLVGAVRNMEWNVPEDYNDFKNFADFMQSIEDKYDYCLFDCPPNPSPYVKCAIRVCTHIIVPLLPNKHSLNGYDMILEELKNIRNETKGQVSPKVLGSLITISDEKNSSTDRKWAETLVKLQGVNSFDTKISRSNYVKNAIELGYPMPYFPWGKNTTSEYISLCYEIMQRIKKSK